MESLIFLLMLLAVCLPIGYALTMLLIYIFDPFERIQYDSYFHMLYECKHIILRLMVGPGVLMILGLILGKLFKYLF